MIRGGGTLGHSKHRKAVKRKVPICGRAKYAVYKISEQLLRVNPMYVAPLRVSEWYSSIGALVKAMKAKSKAKSWVTNPPPMVG